MHSSYLGKSRGRCGPTGTGRGRARRRRLAMGAAPIIAHDVHKKIVIVCAGVKAFRGPAAAIRGAGAMPLPAPETSRRRQADNKPRASRAAVIRIDGN